MQSQLKKSLLCSHWQQHQQTEPKLSGLLVVHYLHLFSLKPFSEIWFFNGLCLIPGSQGFSYLWHAWLDYFQAFPQAFFKQKEKKTKNV